MSIKKWPRCQICGKEVTTKEGIITIYGQDIQKYQELYNDWKSKHEVFELPEMVDWHWGHVNCLKEGMYSISYVRFDTPSKALAWTLHMMEKHWLHFTNWENMVRMHHKLPGV